MKTRFIKLVPNEFVNASRDLRELSVLKELGCEIFVIAKKGKSVNDYGYNCIRKSTRPIYRVSKNLAINRLVSVFTWANEVRRLHPQIISCHNLHTLLIAWISNLVRRSKAFLVYDSHEFEYAKDESRSRIQLLCVKYLERFLMKRCAFSIMVNDSIADEVVKLHHLKARPVVARNFPYYWIIDEQIVKKNRNRFKKEHHIPDNAPLILYQGGLMRRRGIENAIKAIAKLENIYLLVIGNGEPSYVDSLHYLVKCLGIENRIVFLPAAPYAELWKYTGMADVGLCILENVCKNHYYALPNKFSEYIQSLVPMITNDFPEMKRLIDKYKIGKYCNADDVDDLAQTIDELANNNSLLVKYGENLLKAKEDVCWEKESVKLKDAYNGLISRLKKT